MTLHHNQLLRPPTFPLRRYKLSHLYLIKNIYVIIHLIPSLYPTEKLNIYKDNIFFYNNGPNNGKLQLRSKLIVLDAISIYIEFIIYCLQKRHPLFIQHMAPTILGSQIITDLIYGTLFRWPTTVCPQIQKRVNHGSTAPHVDSYMTQPHPKGRSNSGHSANNRIPPWGPLYK